MTERERKYWEQREIDLWKAQDVDTLKVSQKIAKEYQYTASEIQKEIALFYQKYGYENVIEYKELMEGLTQNDRSRVFQDFDKFIFENPQFAHLAEARNNIYKLNRLEALELTLTIRQYELGVSEQAEFSGLLERAYKNGYKGVLDGLPNAGGVIGVPEDSMRLTINKRWTKGLNYSERIWRNRSFLVDAINTDLRNGLIRGDSFQEIADVIAKKFGTSLSNANRLVFTESAYILNQANKQAFVDAGVEQYQFTAVLDGHTSVICEDLNDRVFRFEEAVVGQNYPPMHPWCRSTVVPYGYGSLANLQRSTKD